MPILLKKKKKSYIEIEHLGFSSFFIVIFYLNNAINYIFISQYCISQNLSSIVYTGHWQAGMDLIRSDYPLPIYSQLIIKLIYDYKYSNYIQ
jgi:hypothetical protein